jgi:anti-sigma B factor antagonist
VSLGTLLTVEAVSPQELRLSGELDRSTTDRFDEAVRDVIAGSGPLVLDLSGVRFLDSSGVRSLIKLGLSMRGRDLVLRDPGTQVMRVLTLTRLDQVGLWRIVSGPEPT